MDNFFLFFVIIRKKHNTLVLGVIGARDSEQMIKVHIVKYNTSNSFIVIDIRKKRKLRGKAQTKS